MKNLRKLSRTELKNVKGSKLYPGTGAGGPCADSCNVTGGGPGDTCAQYGLTCGWFECGGVLVNRCM